MSAAPRTRSRPRPRPGPRALVLAALLAAAGCGYSTGLRVSDRYDSVGVEYFRNESLEPDVEVLVQDELSRAVRNLVDAPLVGPADAALVVRGRVLSYRRRGGVNSTDNRLLESGVGIELEAALFPAGSDEPVTPFVRERTWVGYVIGAAENERRARDRALRNLSEKLVLDLFAPLEGGPGGVGGAPAEPLDEDEPSFPIE